jgi:galactose mutarotase-like enzyme
MEIQPHGKHWNVRSGDLVAEVWPDLGGKIKRLYSRASGREFFFQDPRPRPSGRGYLGHDLSGQDECWPTVGKSPGHFAADHGVLWNAPWRARREADRLITWSSRPAGAPVDVVRTLSAPSANRLRLEYTWINLGRRALPFLYSAHPILAVDSRSRLILPGVRRLNALGQNARLRAGRTQPWPRAFSSDGRRVRLDSGLDADRGLAGKWFVQAPPYAAVDFPDARERLELRWDRAALPYLGLWLSLGVPLDLVRPDPRAWVCAALEPCTAPHDVLSQARPRLRLEPGRVFTCWLEWSLARAGRSHS